jgi:hypothetical protein
MRLCGGGGDEDGGRRKFDLRVHFLKVIAILMKKKILKY